MPTRRTLVRTLLTNRLVPLLVQRGFDGPKAISGNSRSHIYSRVVGTEKHELSIDFERYGRARFCLNAFILPGDDANKKPGMIIDVPAACVGPRKLITDGSFSAEPTIIDRIRRRSDDYLVERAIAMCLESLPEVDSWWETREETKHIRSYLAPYAVPKCA